MRIVIIGLFAILSMAIVAVFSLILLAPEMPPPGFYRAQLGTIKLPTAWPTLPPTPTTIPTATVQPSPTARVESALPMIPTMAAVPTLPWVAPTEATALNPPIVAEIEYKDLYRNIETHVGKVLHTTGQIVQVVGLGGLFEDEYTGFRISITKGEFGLYTDPVWVEYHGDKRFLERDIVEFWATVEGLYEYTSIFGGRVELPRLTASDIILLAE